MTNLKSEVKIQPSTPKPAIHGPRIVGATPGRPFLFKIPATGTGPLKFGAANLPPGLKLDVKTGIISGSIRKSGTWAIWLIAANAKGWDTRQLNIVAGKNKLCLTPPMGWNSWNSWATAVDEKKIRAAADWMVKSGLADHGFQYINIDDCWEGKRDSKGRIQSNKKFPNMKKLADYVHSKGLKIGIYSSPGPKTCAGFEGSYQHEIQDAKTYADWGMDYLKHDWCAYEQVAKNHSRAELVKPYRVMRHALDSVKRDIVFSLCQYGMGEVWKWAAKTGGNLWRSTGDITDTWESLETIGFSQDGHEKHAGPGHWNDPDMLIVGRVGWGPNLHPTRLTKTEQVTHMTLWAILAAPLLIGCDLSKLDKFTLALLTNDEVLDVNQDPLGRQGRRLNAKDRTEIWSRRLYDGTLAVGLFNRGPKAVNIQLPLSLLKLKGKQPIRDLWQRKYLGFYGGSFTANVTAHGSVFLKIGVPAA